MAPRSRRRRRRNNRPRLHSIQELFGGTAAQGTTLTVKVSDIKDRGKRPFRITSVEFDLVTALGNSAAVQCRVYSPYYQTGDAQIAAYRATVVGLTPRRIVVRPRQSPWFPSSAPTTWTICALDNLCMKTDGKAISCTVRAIITINLALGPEEMSEACSSERFNLVGEPTVDYPACESICSTEDSRVDPE